MFYGCDSNSNDFPCAADFYIGRIGFGTTPDYTVFNYQAAAAVGCTRTWGYWFLHGPGDATPPATSDAAAYQWGVLQAQAAATAWDGNGSVCGRTIYGDVEGPGQFGWNPVLINLNQRVWQGFYDTLASPSYLFNPGLYSTHHQWTGIMGNYSVPSTTPVWSPDSTNTVPCESCPTSFPALPTIAGVAPTIWQYNITIPGGGCPNDLDLATELPPD